MTEAEWLACIDPDAMMLFIGKKFKARRSKEKWSERKRRLYGCACARRVWQYLPNDSLRQAVEICERFADGLAGEQELFSARETANSVYKGVGDITADYGPMTVAELCQANGQLTFFPGIAFARVAAEEKYDPDTPWHVGFDEEKRTQCELLRDIIGNPFHLARASKSWLRWNDGTLPKIARAIYEERTFGRLPILADALLDAGCDNEDILAHCRGEGPHVRGCWVIDLLLGKE